MLDSPGAAWQGRRYDYKTKKLIFNKLTKIQLTGRVRNQFPGFIGTLIF